jgi:hypothetical protein
MENKFGLSREKFDGDAWCFLKLNLTSKGVAWCIRFIRDSWGFLKFSIRWRRLVLFLKLDLTSPDGVAWCILQFFYSIAGFHPIFENTS